MDDYKIAAVLITHNRLNFLKELVNGLKNQTRKPDKIFVIDNASTDGTEEWLVNQEGLTVIRQDNLGSSGGQYTGIKKAYEQNYDWIWVMDDDVEPEPDCLEKLLNVNNDKALVRAPLRYTPENKPFLYEAISYNLTNPFKSFWIEIVSEEHLNLEEIPAAGITFEGPLIHKEVVKKVGLPEKKFFIFADDTEFFIRVMKQNYNSIIVKNAVLRRKLTFDAYPKNFTWKHYYTIRNLTAIDVLHGSAAVRLLRPVGYLIKWLFRCRKPKDIAVVFKAFIDGYFYKSDN